MLEYSWGSVVAVNRSICLL